MEFCATTESLPGFSFRATLSPAKNQVFTLRHVLTTGDKYKNA